MHTHTVSFCFQADHSNYVISHHKLTSREGTKCIEFTCTEFLQCCSIFYSHPHYSHNYLYSTCLSCRPVFIFLFFRKSFSVKKQWSCPQMFFFVCEVKQVRGCCFRSILSGLSEHKHTRAASPFAWQAFISPPELQPSSSCWEEVSPTLISSSRNSPWWESSLHPRPPPLEEKAWYVPSELLYVVCYWVTRIAAVSQTAAWTHTSRHSVRT